MAYDHPGFRIYILGAGFSRAAGLPLAIELYPAVRSKIEARYGTDTKFHRDLHEYLDYCQKCGIKDQTEESLDLEQFMSYLDIEHFLGLRGGDTWSNEGNEAQLMIRHAIGAVINEQTPQSNALPSAYYHFAEALSPHDTVLTFNYDLLLERAFDHVGKPYRRFPNRFKSVTSTSGTLDSDREEVVLLKLHGSVDWFDDRQYIELRAALRAKGHDSLSLHDVFDVPDRYRAKPLVDGLLPEGDPLRHVHAIEDIDGYYGSSKGLNAPLLLSPSHVKFVYAQPLLGMWRGMGRSGGYNLGLSVIGFSLPQHDEYIRVALHQMISNYGSWWEEPMLGVYKDYARFVDFRASEAAIEEYRERYRFADLDRSRFYYGGFGDGAIEFLFSQQRAAQSKV